MQSVYTFLIQVVRGFIDKLEQVSKNPDLKDEMEAEVLSTNAKSSSSVAGWATWAVGAIGAKFYKSNPVAKRKANKLFQILQVNIIISTFSSTNEFNCAFI